VIFVVVMTFQHSLVKRASPMCRAPQQLTLFGHVFSFGGRSNLSYYALVLFFAAVATAVCLGFCTFSSGVSCGGDPPRSGRAMGVITSLQAVLDFALECHAGQSGRHTLHTTSAF
jgi:hypothetical protein